jgi:hypothetical protein
MNIKREKPKYGGGCFFSVGRTNTLSKVEAKTNVGRVRGRGSFLVCFPARNASCNLRMACTGCKRNVYACRMTVICSSMEREGVKKKRESKMQDGVCQELH